MNTLVALVNGFGSEPRRLADEQALPYPSPSEVLKGLELPTALRSAIGEPSLCRLADALYPVFAADATSDRVRLVNDLLTRSRLRPAVETRADRIQGVWVVGHDRDMLLAAAAVGLREQLSAHDPDRLGTCAGERCGDAYVDTSPGGHRRYCSITCQNRNRVAAFRRRKAGPKSVARRPGEG